MTSNIHAARIRDVVITDKLFGRYAALVADKIIPYQWEALNGRVAEAERSHCIDNFRAAAGEQAGAHQGVVFHDTDAYKWLEAVAFCIENGSGARFIGTADGLIALIGRAQEPDGYLNTYFTLNCPNEKWTNLAEGHELYCAGHLFEAAVAYYNATGKTELLNIARKFADLICERFGEEDGKCKGYPGHQEIELALVKLYDVTNEKRYLDLARFFIIQRGKEPNYLLNEIKSRKGNGIFAEFSAYDAKYAQTHLEPKKQTTAEGHAVRAMYMYSAMADLARECGDDELKSACKALWTNLTKKRMYITGGIGSSSLLERFTADYDLPNDRMYCESCASVGLMMFGSRMNRLTRDASCFDAVERALCNTVLAGMSKNGDNYFYVNPLEVWPENCVESTAMAHVKPVRQKWFACACCPPNIARTLASLGQYIYALDDKSLYINLFISSRITARVSETEIKVKMDSSYMHDGFVRFAVETSSSKPLTVRVRIPGYAASPVFSSQGTPIAPAIEQGYAVIAVSKAGRQEFTLHFEAKPHLVAANRQVRADIGKMTLMKGPFVYCLEQVDNGDNLASVFIKPDVQFEQCPPEKELPGELPVIKYKGQRAVNTILDENELYCAPEYIFKETELTAVPYCLWCNRTPGEMLVWQKVRL